MIQRTTVPRSPAEGPGPSLERKAGGALGGQQIDDPHDRDAAAYILVILWETLVATPHVTLLDCEVLTRTLVDPQFALQTMADHVVCHAHIHRFGFRLIHYVAHRDGLVRGDHRLALAQVNPPHAGSDLRALTRCIGLSHSTFPHDDRRCGGEAESKCGSSVDIFHWNPPIALHRPHARCTRRRANCECC